MRLGLFTPIFNGLTLDALLVELKKYPQIEALEIGTGGWPGNSHLDLDALLASKEAARAYRLKLEDAGSSGRVDTARADNDASVAEFYIKDGNYETAKIKEEALLKALREPTPAKTPTPATERMTVAAE